MTAKTVEDRIMEAITINLNHKLQFKEQYYEDMAYRKLDELIELKGFKDREVATDYYIEWLKGGN